jgi:hypothetical protein
MPNLKSNRPHTVNNATAIGNVTVCQRGEVDQSFPAPTFVKVEQDGGPKHHIHIRNSGGTVKIIPSHAMNERTGIPGSGGGFQHAYEMPEDCVIETIQIDGKPVQFKPKIGVRVEVTFSA